MNETEYILVGTALKNMLIEVRKKHKEFDRDFNDLDKSYRRFVGNNDDIEALRSGIERVRQDREEINKMSREIVNYILNNVTLESPQIDKVMMDGMEKASKHKLEA